MGQRPEDKSKSVILLDYGGYDKIQIQDISLSVELGPNEIKVRNNFCGVNFADLYTLKGLFELNTPLTMGLESAGKVIEVGTAVKEIKVGDRVVCYKWTGGLYSEIVILNSNNCFVIPPEIDDEDAVALPANYLTAYFTLVKIAKLEAGQSVLIHSCAGGVGWAATQIASLQDNVTILGTTSENKFEKVSENGVKHPMTYESYSCIINQIVGDGKVDHIIDCIGGTNFSTSQKLLRPLGKVILTGCSSLIKGPEKFTSFERETLSNATSADMQELVMGSKSVSGFHLGLLMDQYPDLIRSSMKTLFQYLSEGKIKPKIDSVWPFEKVVEAVSLLEKGKNIGKVLLRV